LLFFGLTLLTLRPQGVLSLLVKSFPKKTNTQFSWALVCVVCRLSGLLEWALGAFVVVWLEA